MMAEGNGLSCLQMCETWHDGFRLALSQVQQGTLQVMQARGNFVNLIPHVKPDIGGDLIIA